MGTFLSFLNSLPLGGEQWEESRLSEGAEFHIQEIISKKGHKVIICGIVLKGII